MWKKLEPHLLELGRRAGMRGVPAGVVAIAMGLALVAVLWAAWRWWPAGAAGDTGASAAVTAPVIGQAGAPEGLSDAEQAAQPEAPGPGAEASAASSLVVHVAGEVRRPGVYGMPAGSRVVDAIEAAGGPLGGAATDALNLARPVADGEQVLVPSKDAVADGSFAAPSGSAAGGVATAAGAGTALVNINTADATALDTLPGVGPSTAQKIVADREANGPFGSPEDLGRVSGIGPKRLEQLKDLISVR